MYSQAKHVRERSRIFVRVAGLCAAIATALLIAAAGAGGPLAQEGTDPQDQAPGSGQPTMEEKIVFSSSRDNPAPPFVGSGCDPSNMTPFNYARCNGLNSGELYLMDLDGTDPVRLTTNTDLDVFAALSPNGKNIVFDSNRLRDPLTELINTSDLFVMNTDGTEPMYVVRGSSATWSPDSKNIAFHRSASGTGGPIFNFNPGAPTTDSDIFALKVELDGLNPAEPDANEDEPKLTNLTDNGNATIDDDADWSPKDAPNGDQILFTRYDPATVPKPINSGSNVFTRDIWVMNADGSGKKNLTNNNQEERGATWSPDGTHIVYGCRRPETNGDFLTFEICVMDRNGNNEKVLTSNALADLAASWSPDGNQIVFQRPVGTEGNTQIFVMALQCGDVPCSDPSADGAITGASNATPLTDGASQGVQLAPRAGVLRVSDDEGSAE